MTAKIDNTQKSCPCMLSGDIDEQVHYIIQQTGTQKEYKSMNDWVGRVIHWKLCKRLKCDHTKKIL